MNSIRPLCTAAVLVALVAVLPAQAATFSVTLTNGAVFETRYQPKQDPTFEGKILLLTDVGNWVALPKELVASISSDVESKGFGTMLDTQTIALGWAPNDASRPAPVEQDSAARLLNYFQQRDRPQDFSVRQFVNVEDAGMGGLPAGAVYTSGQTTFPVASGSTISTEPGVLQPRR